MFHMGQGVKQKQQPESPVFTPWSEKIIFPVREKVFPSQTDKTVHPKWENGTDWEKKYKVQV